MNAKELNRTLRGNLIGRRAIAEERSGRRAAIAGTVRDETKNTLTIETDNGEMKRITKRDNTITIIDMGRKTIIDGREIGHRIEDRPKMKVEQ